MAFLLGLVALVGVTGISHCIIIGESVTRHSPKTHINNLTSLPVMVTTLVSITMALAGCHKGSMLTVSTPAHKPFVPVKLNLAHINDHHSHLDADGTLEVNINGVIYHTDLGGFARISQVFLDLGSQFGDENFLKLHAGDALTGTSYYSYYQGNADADMMNTVCFDAFELGNHEFDDGDANLKSFITRLNQGACKTPVLGANVKPKVGTPLALDATAATIKPYIIKTTKEGVKVGIIGIAIRGKTQKSSRPWDTTAFLEEKTTAQNHINVLKRQGIEHIVLLTHQGHEVDQAMASQLTGVDVIIGGDSHTLLGDFSRYTTGTLTTSIMTQGRYPTITHNKDGETVCIGQSWEYAKSVGLMQVTFDNKGAVASCNGSTILPVSKQLQQYNAFTKQYTPVDAALNRRYLDLFNVGKLNIGSKSVIYPTEANSEATRVLNRYKHQLQSKLAEKIGTAADPFCLVRVPGTSQSASVTGCGNTANAARGSDVAQLVAKAFLTASPRADFSLQNAGGVRDALPAGDITHKTVNTLLPFNNTLVNLTMTGSQVVTALEDAIQNASFGVNGERPSTGAHPYADGLRWDLQLNQPKGNRVKNVEVRDRITGTWSPIDLNKIYVMVTNDYIAKGKDGYITLAEVSKDPSNVEDTKLLYRQALIDYIKAKSAIALPNRSDYAHKTVTTANGRLLNP